MNAFIRRGGFVLSLTVSGCGGGTPDGAPIDPDILSAVTVQPRFLNPTLACDSARIEKTADVDALPGGVWIGSLVDCQNNTRYDYVEALVSEDGSFRVIAKYDHLLVGSLETDGDLFYGAGVDFVAWDIGNLSGQVASLVVHGAVSEGEIFDGQWETELGLTDTSRLITDQ